MANNGYYPPVVPPAGQNVRRPVAEFFRVEDDCDEEEQLRNNAMAQQAIRRVRPYGVGDNVPNYTRWLHVSEAYRQLIFENLHIAPFSGPIVTDPRAAAIT
jgi:hypothetical protein